MGHRILIAEDDPEIVLLMQKLLAGYEVEVCSDGVSALQRLEQDPLPDLLLLDVMMPKLDGVTLLKTLKSHPRTKRIPAIIVSAKGGPKDVIDGIAAGVKHYLTKPFKAEDLLKKVRKILG